RIEPAKPNVVPSGGHWGWGGAKAAQAVSSWSALGVLLEEFHRVAHGQNGFRRVVGNLAAELLLEGHHQLDRVEAVGTEIVDEACTLDHLFGLHAQVLHDDLLHPLADITHRLNL